MLHPQVMQQEAARCLNTKTPYCTEVQNTFQLFIELVNLRSQSPEKFGELILQQEEQLTQLKQQYQDLMQQNAPSEQLDRAKQAYQVQQDKINDYLAIVAVTSSPNL